MVEVLRVSTRFNGAFIVPLKETDDNSFSPHLGEYGTLDIVHSACDCFFAAIFRGSLVQGD